MLQKILENVGKPKGTMVQYIKEKNFVFWYCTLFEYVKYTIKSYQKILWMEVPYQ